MTLPLSTLATIALIFAFAWLYRLFANAPVIESGRVWQCSYCDGWFGEDWVSRPDAPSNFTGTISHGMCKHCSEAWKKELARQRQESHHQT